MVGIVLLSGRQVYQGCAGVVVAPVGRASFQVMLQEGVTVVRRSCDLTPISEQYYLSHDFKSPAQWAYELQVKIYTASLERCLYMGCGLDDEVVQMYANAVVDSEEALKRCLNTT